MLKICMFALLGVSTLLLLRQWKADLLPLLRMALWLGLGMAALSLLTPAVRYLQSLLGGSLLHAEQVTVLFKALGITLLTQICADLCRDCGENGAAAGVEWTGRLEILLLCIPFVEELLTVAKELLSWGGAA